MMPGRLRPNPSVCTFGVSIHGFACRSISERSRAYVFGVRNLTERSAYMLPSSPPTTISHHSGSTETPMTCTDSCASRRIFPGRPGPLISASVSSMYPASKTCVTADETVVGLMPVKRAMSAREIGPWLLSASTTARCVIRPRSCGRKCDVMAFFMVYSIPSMAISSKVAANARIVLSASSTLCVPLVRPA